LINHRKGSALFLGENISSIIILRDILTKEATKRKIKLDVFCGNHYISMIISIFISTSRSLFKDRQESFYRSSREKHIQSPGIDSSAIKHGLRFNSKDKNLGCVRGMGTQVGSKRKFMFRVSGFTAKRDRSQIAYGERR